MHEADPPAVNLMGKDDVAEKDAISSVAPCKKRPGTPSRLLENEAWKERWEQPCVCQANWRGSSPRIPALLSSRFSRDGA